MLLNIKNVKSYKIMCFYKLESYQLSLQVYLCGSIGIAPVYNVEGRVFATRHARFVFVIVINKYPNILNLRSLLSYLRNK